MAWAVGASPICLGVFFSANRNNYIGTGLTAFSSAITLGYYVHSQIIHNSQSVTYQISNAGTYASLLAGAHCAYLWNYKYGLLLAGLGSFLSLSLRTRNDWEYFNPSNPIYSSHLLNDPPMMNHYYLVVPALQQFILLTKNIRRRENTPLYPIDMVHYLLTKSVLIARKVHPIEHSTYRFEQEKNLHKDTQALVTDFKLSFQKRTLDDNQLPALEQFYVILNYCKHAMMQEKTIYYATDERRYSATDHIPGFWYESAKVLSTYEHDFKCSHAFLHKYLQRFGIIKEDSDTFYSLVSGSIRQSLPQQLNKYIAAFIFLDLKRGWNFSELIDQFRLGNIVPCPGAYKFMWYAGFNYAEIFWNKEKKYLNNYKGIIIQKNALGLHKKHSQNCVFCNEYWTDEDTQIINDYKNSEEQPVSESFFNAID